MSIKVYSKEALARQRPTVAFPRNFRFDQHLRQGERQNGRQVYEFIGTDTFSAEWNERRRFEVDAGRDMEPILYTPIYSIVNDANLPKNVDVLRMGPGGVVLTEIQEGGEVKFASITSSEYTVPIVHYGAGLEYSDDLVTYNQTWQVPIVERQLGIAYNALLNHIHLDPIISFSYTAANQTAANTGGATTQEDFLLTIEDAITNSKADTANPRRGPYVLLVSSANEIMVRKALMQVPQEGVSLQDGMTMDQIRAVIAYDGWTGTRGALATTYSGVSSGTAYLIDTANNMTDFQSFVKQGLEEYGRQEDVSRFLLQIVWDTRFGVFANPEASVEEITWP